MPDTTIDFSFLAKRIETLSNSVGDLKADMAVMMAILQRIEGSIARRQTTTFGSRS